MSTAEKRALAWIEEHRELLFLIIISVLALLARSYNLDNESSDAQGSLLPWFDEIKEAGGLRSLSEQVGNYTILYQLLIALMTCLPFDPLRMYKYLSILFDFVMAFTAAGFLYRLTERRSRLVPLAGYAIILFIPTVIANSAIIAQCDSIYTAFAVLAVWMLYEGKYRRAFIFLGLGFSFKLQIIFILPFFLLYYVCEKRFSILNFLYIPLVYYLTCIPGLAAGRSLLDPIRVYMHQTVQYDAMFMNFPSFWQLFSDNYYIFRNVALVLVIAVFGSMLLVLMSEKADLTGRGLFLKLMCWSVWTCVLFLPAMHERYAYMLDVMLVILAMVCPSFAGFSILAVCASMLSVGTSFYGVSFDLQMAAIVYTTGYFLFSYHTVRSLRSPISDSGYDNGFSKT